MTDIMTLEEIVATHLEHDFVVPYSPEEIEKLIPLCVEAIKIVNKHDMDTRLDLPDGWEWISHDTGIRHTSAPAYEFVRVFRLDQYLDGSWK